MTGQQLKIIFKDNRAYLTREKTFSLEQLGLSEIVQSFKHQAYWTVKVLNYIEPERKLFCEITSYDLGKTSIAPIQKSLYGKLNQIQKISFQSIDTNGLLKTTVKTAPCEKSTKTVSFKGIQSVNIEPKANQKKILIKETFIVPLKKLRFKTGGVSFDKTFKQHSESIEVTITNYELREEFDAIKNYFANILKTKKITVSATIEIEDDEVVSVDAKSPEIRRIDKQLIDQVKFDFVKATTKKKLKVEIDKSLFTREEYFDTFADEKFKSNTFYADDQALLEDLLNISNTRHYRHLRYLSSIHAYDTMKLRFIHKPFSFIFLVKGHRHFHFIWETLNTEEATYVWHTDKNVKTLKMTLRKIEDIINVVKVQGKTAYINSSEDAYRRIFHDYSNLVEGFVKWKGDLESILT